MLPMDLSQTKPVNSPDRHNHKAVIAFSVLLIAFCTAYYPVFRSLIKTWYASDDASHGFLIIPAALYIVWRNRSRLSELPIVPSWWGMLLVVISLTLYLFAKLAGIATLSPLSLILTIAGSILFLGGYRFLVALLFPIALLLLMIPIPSQIYSALTLPLQLIVSKVSAITTTLIGIPVYLEGNVINLPNYTFEVVQACSGLRSIMSLFTLAALYGYFTLSSPLLRTFLFVLALPIAVLVNIARISVMVIAYYYFNFNLTSEPIHTWYGMAIFGLSFILFLLTQKVLSKWDK
ncbi:exosortase [Geobacter pelophilus]|uniref:Exosortase n=2 Tax=Geoanaerobacter pelophilus TaxID=60036 RepID=A0AAW4KYV9_9BACT|nr:exosortase [Geoanaerobacter pelophilus]